MAPADEATHTPESDAALAPQTTDTSTDGQQAPPEKDWKEEYARLRTDYDTKAAELKALKKDPKPATKKATQEADTLWIVQHADDLKMVGTEYESYREKGYDREDALKLAKVDKGILKTSVDPHAQRQAAISGETDFVNREGSSQPDVPEVAQRLGVKPETVAKFKSFVEG